MKARAIPTLSILEIFDQLYHSGVDYVDLHIEQGVDKDTLTFTFTEQYIDPDYIENFQEDEPSNLKVEGKLTDDDLKELL